MDAAVVAIFGKTAHQNHAQWRHSSSSIYAEILRSALFDKK